MVDFLKSSLEHYFAFVVDLESSFEIVDWFVFIFCFGYKGLQFVGNILLSIREKGGQILED